MEKFALISVSDREGILEFAQGLSELGYSLLTTSGTQRYLSEQGIPTCSIAEYTGQKEILGGRVKTLHPKIHAGILAQRSDAQHLAELSSQGIPLIDVVAVNLYPFEEQLQQRGEKSLPELIEYIDIGGPTMIRAAAKNCESVYAVIEPHDYSAVLEALRSSEANKTTAPDLFDLRLQLSQKVFTRLAHYNLEIAKYLSEESESLSEREYVAGGRQRSFGQVWRQAQSLRYGENPHQSARLFRSVSAPVTGWRQIGGKELSYNNILDADAGYRLTRSLYSQRERFGSGEVVSIMKHLTPCGVSVASTQEEALTRAKASDPRSHFGGIIGFASELTAPAAEAIAEDFAEIVIAPSFSDEARAVLSRKSNLRLLECDYSMPIASELRSTLFGYLEQSPDLSGCSVRDGEIMSGSLEDPSLLQELELAWAVVAHVKSNAIVLFQGQQLIGSGAGQTSRIDSVEVALYKAKEHKHRIQGAVAASDAFFPFPDSLERLAAEGVTAVVTPSGSKKDPEVVEVARQLGMTLIFTPERHFRH
ncbi:bifunctional phosphoribosylaminoimidazolecarboxamide formyltransferase/IMP cyclohydrolase PurH [bacterium]|jgi:phosphoribosylaminoimidazolecarboxamide formyltransferase/IMP cyclohydrolase|nr:bifunctional phosphoribosylaminoimidazolecarboxamide formyltransferase/IMP cyclohydrolase PurH [bacterium]